MDKRFKIGDKFADNNKVLEIINISDEGYLVNVKVAGFKLNDITVNGSFLGLCKKLN